jgi:hypothetical protein
MEVYSTHTSTGQEEARLYMALCEWAPHVILRDRVLTVKCYCGKSSIPISSAGCPGCGYGRCAYCTTTRVQVRASAAKSQLQKADGPALSIRALSRTSGHRPLSSSNAYKSWAKLPASDMDIHRHNHKCMQWRTSATDRVRCRVMRRETGEFTCNHQMQPVLWFVCWLPNACVALIRRPVWATK